jgi:murein DD-endopeptidase MepM/ murein hydrolase activator NlpD
MMERNAVLRQGACISVYFALAALGLAQTRPADERVPLSPKTTSPPAKTTTSPLTASTQVPVPWSPPIRSPIWSGQIDVNAWKPGVGQGDGRFIIRQGRKHPAVDLTASEGTFVHSAAKGVVEFCGWQNSRNPKAGAGFHVRIKYTEGPLKDFTISYQHLQDKKQFHEGELVGPGQVIGYVGRTGNVPPEAETHLHMQMKDPTGKPVVPNLTPYSPPGSSHSPVRGELSGVLVNPSPKRTEHELDSAELKKSLERRPGGKAKSWRIELPKQGAEDDHEND